MRNIIKFFIGKFSFGKENGKNDEIVQLLKLLKYCCIKYILAADHVRWSLFIGHGYFRA